MFAKEILTGGLSNSAFFLSIVIASGITFVAGYANLGRFLVSNDGNKASVCSDPFRHNEAQYVSYGPGYHARFPWEKEMGVFSLAPLTSNVEQSVNTMSGKAFIKAVVQWEVDLGAVDVHRI